jgi:Mg2+-importing ATPase
VPSRVGRSLKEPRLYWPILLLTLLAYLGLTQIIKVWLLRRKWI